MVIRKIASMLALAAVVLSGSAFGSAIPANAELARPGLVKSVVRPKILLETPQQGRITLNDPASSSNVLNVRVGPSQSQAILGYLDHGDSVVVLGSTRGSDGVLWYVVHDGTFPGWVRSDFVILD